MSMAACWAQEARFDRHFVRDLTWSRHQLEELAERRFVAAQRAAGSRLAAPSHDGAWTGDASDAIPTSFNDLFKQVRRPALSRAAGIARLCANFYFTVIFDMLQFC